MLPFLRREDDGARQRIDAAVAALRQCQRDGTPAVAVADVLELLGADPGPPAPQAPERDPRADPLTGCRSPLAG